MPIALPKLPYALDALEPFMSRATLALHHGHHHKGYVEKLNEIIAGTALESLGLETIIRETAGDSARAAIFNNAAQAGNHNFFWTCMGPGTKQEPVGALADEIHKTYGSLSGFKTAFLEAVAVQFGSGWIWLVREDGQLKIERTANAGTPIGAGAHPLLVCDLWEHAYYLDYQDRRAEFAEKFLSNLVNWEFVATRFTAALSAPHAERNAA